MAFINIIMGLVAAVLVVTGIKKDTPDPSAEKTPSVEVGVIKPKIDRSFDFEKMKKKLPKF